jgi:alpha-glucosidase
VMEQGTRTGLPLLRPLFLEFPDAAADHHPIDVDLAAGGEFMVGPDLLVAAPPFPDRANDYDAELPSAGWYDFWTGKRVTGGNTPALTGDTLTVAAMSTISIHPELATLPVFVRPGAIIPTEPLVQSTAEKPEGPLTLRVFPGPNCAGEIYQDDGSTFGYRKGEFLRMKFTCETSSKNGDLAIHIGTHDGHYPAWWNEVVVEVNGLTTNTASATVNGRAAKVTSSDQRLSIPAADRGIGIEIIVRQ